MRHLTIEDVLKSYNGKRGCMCGCIGKYSLVSEDQIEPANKLCGYEAYSEEDVRLRSVKLAVNKLNKAIDEYFDLTTRDEMNEGIFSVRGDDFSFSVNNGWCNSKWVSLDTGDDRTGRNTTIYLYDDVDLEI